MPGIKITDEDRQRIDAKFICTSCKLLLYLPMQTTCGHLMCQSCIETLLKSSNPQCPEDDEALTQETVFPDAFARRELRGIHLHCSNPGCSWHSTYDQLEVHAQVCEHALIKCVHFQCPMKFQRPYMGEHLKSECEYRNVKCDNCQEDVAFASMDAHLRTSCENAPVACRYCKKHVLRRDIEKHESESCEAVPVTCEFHAVGCNSEKTLKRGESRQHLNNGLINHCSLLLQFVTQLSNHIPRPEFTGAMQTIRDDITDVRSGLERRIETLESSGGGDARLRNEVSEMKVKVRDLTAECSNLRQQNMRLERDRMSIDRLHSRVDQVNQSVVDMKRMYDSLREKIMSLERQFRDSMSIIGRVQCTEDVECQRGPRFQQAIIRCHIDAQQQEQQEQQQQQQQQQQHQQHFGGH